MEAASSFAQLNLLTCFTLSFFFIGALLSVKLEKSEEALRRYNSATRSARGLAGSVRRSASRSMQGRSRSSMAVFTDLITTAFSTSTTATVGVFVATHPHDLFSL